MPQSFLTALAHGTPIVLDGGLGTLLADRGNDLSDPLWSARILLDNPSEVQAAHEEFFRAGARVAISPSYQVSYEPLAREGFTPADVDELLLRSVTVAQAARTACGLDDTGWVAASVGPYGATLADGSEYTGDYGLTVDELRTWHRRRLGVLAASGADVLAVETIPSLAEVQAIVAELELLPSAPPAWLSVTIADGALRSGEPLDAAFALAAASDAVVAVGVNCCDPADVAPALEGARMVTSKPLVAYPNSGERWDAEARKWVGAADAIAIPVEVQLIGGCCRVRPDAISAIAESRSHASAEARETARR